MKSKLWKDSTSDEIARDIGMLAHPEPGITIGIIGHGDYGKAEAIAAALIREMDKEVKIVHVDADNPLPKNIGIVNDIPAIEATLVLNNYCEIMEEVDREIEIEPKKKKKSRKSRMHKQAMYGGKR